MTSTVKSIMARLQGTPVTAMEGAPEFHQLLTDMSATFGRAKNTGNGYLWMASSGKCSLKIWVYEPKRGMVKGRVELTTPFTEMLDKLDTDSRDGHIRANFAEGKISQFKARVLAHLRNSAVAQEQDIAEDQQSLKFLKSFK